MRSALFLNELINITLSFGIECVFILACTKKNNRRFLIVPIFFIKLIIVNYFIDLVMASRYNSSLIFFIFEIVANIMSYAFIILVRWSIQCTWSKCAVIFLVSELCTMICTSIPQILLIFLRWARPENTYDMNDWMRWGGVIISCCCMRFFLTPFLRWIKNKKIKHPLFWETEIIIYCLLGLFMSIRVSSQTGNRRLQYTYAYQIWVSVFLVFAIIFICVLFQRQRNRQLELENERLQVERNMLLDYYNLLNRQIDWTRKFRHDVANHLQTVEGLLELSKLRTQDTMHYANTLRKQCERLYTVRYCNNQLINTVIENKVQKCEKNNIRIEIDMDDISLGKIEEFDFLSVLFNLLDNAIEGCLEVKDLEERRIQFVCFNVAGQIGLVITNNTSSEPVIRRGKLISTKKHQQYHGVGMQIVEENVRKYHGMSSVKFENQKFTVSINMET